jgi:hypothetical protein
MANRRQSPKSVAIKEEILPHDKQSKQLRRREIEVFEEISRIFGMKFTVGSSYGQVF